MSQAAKQRDWERFGQPWVAVSLDFEVGEKIDLVTLVQVLLGFSVEQLPEHCTVPRELKNGIEMYNHLIMCVSRRK